MACDEPIKAWKSDRDPSTRRVTVYFKEGSKGAVAPLNLPCGRCDGCRLDNARQVALRAMNEASMHDHSCFVTLTYSDSHLPKGGCLAPIHLVKFWKRLRISLVRSGAHSGKVRYLACGEYGTQTLRPHYHAIIFGLWPPDAVLFSESGSGRLYTSAFLDSVWGHGLVTFGSVSPASVSYVARYTSKKAGSKQFALDPNTGELVPEFRTASRRPGLGRSWFDRFQSDVKADSVYIERGIVSTVPRYYLNLLEKVDQVAFDQVKAGRSDRMHAALLEDPHGTARPAKIAIRDARLKLSRSTL